MIILKAFLLTATWCLFGFIMWTATFGTLM